MQDRNAGESTGGSRVPYGAPQLKRLGSAVELTKDRLMIGDRDGGANNTRTG